MAKQYVCVDVYQVEAGDTLYSIAQRYDIPVALLMRANKICNPYNLRAGTKLCIPGAPSTAPVCKGTLHTVVSGDTLYMIAKHYRVSLNAIMEANPNMDPYNLRVGMKLCIPK